MYLFIASLHSQWKNTIIYLLLILCFSQLQACSYSAKKQLYLAHANHLPKANIQTSIKGLQNCTDSTDPSLNLNSSEPIIVIVHGCFSSAGRFRALADVFAFHGQQTVCFEYDDRDSLEKSSGELIDAVNALNEQLPSSKITVIGHSQGGLVSRRALIDDRADGKKLANYNLDLVTISAPFSGINASSHCNWPTLTWLSLGIVKPLCYMITGSKYDEIPPNSTFINSPGELNSAVNRHIRIATDENNSCRFYNKQGQCYEDDFVFSINEQQQIKVDSDPRVEAVLIKAGHVEIVGNETTSPDKLIELLQTEKIMKSTPTEQQAELQVLLQQLYTSQ